MVEQENYSKHSFRDGRACNFGGSSEKRIFSSLWAFHGTQASVGFEASETGHRFQSVCLVSQQF
jgi:hypothetical protein